MKRTTNQYSVTEFDQVAGVYSGQVHTHAFPSVCTFMACGYAPQIVPPAITLKYDFSPIMVQIKEQHRSFLQFITSLCAIVGGVFVVSGFINSSLFKTIQLLGKPKASTNVE